MAQDWRYYVPPNLRGPLSEAGRVGYNLLDNLIGFDDEYDTTGELLTRSLREDPLGTLGSMAGGLYEGAKTAVTQPVQTAREAADEFANTFLRLREPLPEDATREDISQRTADLSLLASLIPALKGTPAIVRAIGSTVPSRRPDVLDDPWANLDFDNLPETTLAEELMLPDIDEVPEAELDPWSNLDFEDFPDDILWNENGLVEPEIAAAQADPLLARRDAFVAALGGEGAFQNALRGDFDINPADPDEAASNLGGFPVLERTVFDPEDGPQPEQFTVSQLAAMNPDAVRALVDQIRNDPAGYIHSPELVDMLADMTPQELADITGLPIQPYAGASTGFQQTPFVFDPDDLPDPFDLDGPQPTDAQIAQVQAEQDQIDQAILQALEAPNPWANVQDADDPFRGLPGSRTLPDTAPATAIADANPYMPTDTAFQKPQTWEGQGIAGTYSRSGRAAAQLRQPRYTDIETLRRELEARGASPRELDYQIDAFDEDFAAGPVSREDVQRFFSDYDTGLMIDRTLKFAGGYMPSGGRNATSTVFYHPEGQFYPPGAKRHFSDVESSAGQNAPPLFHSRAAQYDLGFPGGGTTHHVAEIQSDFAQYRQTLSKEDRDAFDQQYDAPYIRRENDWVDAAIRQNLIDAVNSGSDWITFGNGRQANQHIGMPLEAAKSFYDARVPRRLEDVLRRFSNRAGIEAPTLEKVPFADGDDVLGFRITPEFREALIQNGLPSYKNGGIVSLL